MLSRLGLVAIGAGAVMVGVYAPFTSNDPPQTDSKTNKETSDNDALHFIGEKISTNTEPTNFVVAQPAVVESESTIYSSYIASAVVETPHTTSRHQKEESN